MNIWATGWTSCRGLAVGAFLTITLWVGSERAGLAAGAGAVDILGGLRPEHPRLLLTSNDFALLQSARGAATGETAAIVERADAAARLALEQPLLAYEKTGRRLLSVSREAFRRICLWGFAYRMSGDKVFAERAEREMLNLAAFTDWNPSHFLDVAEMTAAMALGYDWLHDALPARSRAIIRRAIVTHGINPALDPKANWNGWQRTENNWNQVCFGGLTLGALAVAEDEPALARELLGRAQTNNAAGLRPYAPDGVYPEGPGYWSYGTTYQVLMLEALESALGTDWDLAASPGFMASAPALLQQIGPTGRPYNFSDGHDPVAFRTTLFWFAQKLKRPELVYAQRQLLRQPLAAGQKALPEEYLLPLLAKWTLGLPDSIPAPALPLAWMGDGPNPVGVFRSSWTDPDALYLAFKGGSAGLSHGHMDAGSFVLEADGVRWSVDLGSQNYYSIESKGWALFKREQDGDRWRVYRLNNFSHSTLTLGGQLHRVNGDARIVEFTTNSATVNLTEFFAGQAESVLRHFKVEVDRSVVVRDEICGAKPGLSVRWQMVTQAEIHRDGPRAKLASGQRVLGAKLLAPTGGHFEVRSAQPPHDGVNQSNPGACILAVDSKVPKSGQLVIEVMLKPE